MTPSLTIIAILVGGGAIAAGTALSIRARPAPLASFGWAVAAACGSAVLAAAAGLAVPVSDGLRGAGLQLLAVLLAAALGALCHGGPAEGAVQASPVSSIGRAVAWLTLIGLPPTVGFHGKILVYRALLAAGWGWLAVLAGAASVAALAPALWAIRPGAAGPAGALRAAIAVALIAAVCLLGLCPQPALEIAGALASPAIAR